MSDVQVIGDKIDLSELVARLARAVDRKDRSAIIACYSEQSFDDHGRFRGGREAFADFVCNDFGLSSRLDFVYHLLGQSIFDIEGDEAFGESCFAYWIRIEPDHLYQAIGRYLDYFERAEDGWKITYRRVVMDWDGSVPSTDAPGSGLFLGSRDMQDPSYTRLRWPVDPATPTSSGA